jgi:hypothetical protein
LDLDVVEDGKLQAGPLLGYRKLDDLHALS